MHPVERTLQALRRDPTCIRCAKVEYRNRFSLNTHDLFGADVIALFANLIMLIQVTDMGHRANHVRAANKSEEARDWVRAGGVFEVWAWRKLAKSGWTAAKTAVGYTGKAKGVE